MLVLTRKKDESIIIDGNIEVVVIGIEEGKVKLGIKAPKDVDIHRKEIFEAIQEENKKAASGTFDMEKLKGLFKK